MGNTPKSGIGIRVFKKCPIVPYLNIKFNVC